MLPGVHFQPGAADVLNNRGNALFELDRNEEALASYDRALAIQPDYAHALNKPTILLAQRGKELPFDIRSYRVIFYDDSIGGKPALERNLQKHLEAILRES